jgi:hypothetical protein
MTVEADLGAEMEHLLAIQSMGKMMVLIILVMGITQRSLKAIMVRLNLLFPEIIVAVLNLLLLKKVKLD